MTFEERVERIVDDKFTHQLSLMQESADRTSDLLERLDDIHRILPLVRDIKTEVDQLQKRLNSEPNEDDEDQQDEPVDNDRDLKPEDLDKFDDFLKDLEDAVKDLEKAKRLKLPDASKLPRIDWTRLVWYLWNVVRNIQKDIKDTYNNSLDRRFQNETSTTLDRLNQAVQSVDDSLINAKDSILDALERCCDGMSDALAACCDNMDKKMSNLQETADDVYHMLQNLDPSAMPNKDLSLQSKTKAILAEVQAIRGLL